MSVPPVTKRKYYVLFVLAAVIYTAGVVAFSFWSYLQQCSHLLAEDDQTLINATHATEQILGSLFIACAVETETPYEIGYAANQANLNRFANNCQFDLLGALGHKGSKTWTLIAGGKQKKTHTPDASDLHDLLQANLSAAVKALADSGDSPIQMHTLEVEEYGKLRIAIHYHAISTDKGYAVLVAHSTHDVDQHIDALILRTVAIALFLHIMAFPLIILFNRAHAKTTEETENLNIELQQDVIRQKAREAELEDAILDLERFNAVALGRENRIIELKGEVNILLAQDNRQKRYTVDHVD